MDLNDTILNIIAKKLRSQASAEELHILDQWRASGSANEKEYEEIANIWEVSGQALKPSVFNADAAWTKINRNIEAKEIKRTPLITPSFFTFRKMTAAAAILLVLAGAAFWWAKGFNSWNKLTAGTENKAVRLPEGSVITLRKGSSLEYPAVFSNNERVVKLSGEAFFHVQGNEKQPFRIAAGRLQVKVLGTSFLVRSAETRDEVVVVAGKVSISVNGQDKQLVLTAGQKIVLENDHVEQTAVTDSNFIAWQTGILDFRNAALVKVLEDISQYYNVPVSVKQGQEGTSGKIRINVRFENQSFNQVLDEIRLTTGLAMQKEADQIVFFHK